MKIEKGNINKKFDRELYWVRIEFMSDDKKKKTQVFACVSWEYLVDQYPIGGMDKITDSHLADWLDNVINKWTARGPYIFNQDTHFDIYASSPEGEYNQANFLKELRQ